MTDLIVCKPISKESAVAIVHKYHYAKVMPRLTKHYIGFFRNDEILIGMISLGWGVRPVNTIQRLFPSLVSKDYLEIGKFCLRDEEPKNTESQCLSLVIRWLHENRVKQNSCSLNLQSFGHESIQKIKICNGRLRPKVQR